MMEDEADIANLASILAFALCHSKNPSEARLAWFSGCGNDTW
jgi:hypothetical protein